MAKLLHAKVGPGIDAHELPDVQHLGTVDDFYASFEWSDGGLVHVHIALWIVGAPRIDKVVVPKEDLDEGYVEIEVPIEGDTVLPQEQAASLMSAFWERGYTECNLAKAISVAQMGKRASMRRPIPSVRWRRTQVRGSNWVAKWSESDPRRSHFRTQQCATAC